MGSLINIREFSRKIRPATPNPKPSVEKLLQQANTLAPTQAEGIYRKILLIEPDHVSALLALGTILYGRKSFELAREYFIAAISINPRCALAHFHLGDTFDDLGYPHTAIEEYKMAIALSPDHADSHYNLANTYEKVDEPWKALVHWRWYAKLDPLGYWHDRAKRREKRLLKGKRLFLVENAS